MGSLKPEKLIHSLFWGLEIQNPGVSRLVPSGGSEEELQAPSPHSWGLPTVLGVHGL